MSHEKKNFKEIELINKIDKVSNLKENINNDELSNLNDDIEKSNRNFIIKEESNVVKINSHQNKQLRSSEINIIVNSNKSKIKTNIRKIFINNSQKNTQKYNYINNYVKSSIYTIYDFLPKSLLFQFRRYANIYFLFVTILQCIPEISPLNPITAVFPFAFVLCISMIREGFEDIKRHKQDGIENSLKVEIFNTNFNPESELDKRELFTFEQSQNIRVGNIVKITKNSVIPADLVILSCSNPSKTAYIETSNLDGEKNLKPIQCLLKTFNLLKNVEDDKILRFRGKIKCIQPTTELSTFNGEIFLDAKKNGLKVDRKNFLYKGTTLKDTDWALGVVVYTGRETKIILNINKSNGKTSHLEMLINRLMILIFFIQMLLCIFCAIGSSFMFYNTFRTYFDSSGKQKINQKYLEFPDEHSSFYSGLISFFSYLLLFNTMIPISLVVTLEMVKYGQSYFMRWDVDMYSTLRSKYVEVNSCSLNEEMGQIKYIFSDKTGTLTTNKLVFKKAFIWDTEFGKLIEELDQTASRSNNNNESTIKSIKNNSFPFDEVKSYSVYGKEGNKCEIDLYSGTNKHYLKLCNTRDIINQFLYCIALNQNCFISKTLKTKAPPGLRRVTTGPQKKLDALIASNYKRTETLTVDPNLVENYEINYTGESPDEIILTNSIKEMGVVYFEGDDRKKIVGVLKGANGSETYVKEEFEILKIMEFNSERGMSSIIVKKEGRIYLYSKGGDGKISLRLSEKNNHNKQKIFDKVKSCSEKGYRVLCSAMKILDDVEYDKWQNELNDGLEKLEDEKEKEKFSNQKYLEIEKGLILLGCTVVEDKLQDKVPETIKELQSAGINIWVLTGDNLETARNIGIMCNLLPEKMEKYFLFGEVIKMKKNLEENFKIFIGETDNGITEAHQNIESFEKQNRKFYEVPQKNPDKTVKDPVYEAYEANQNLKILLFILLKNLKEKMQLDSKDPERIGVLRGLIIEMGCLNCILPPQIKNFPGDLYNHPLTQLFLDVALSVQAVVCCRTSPKMKSSVVEIVKRNIRGAITLAIGDGANDVSMISMADVGVGLYGEEGSQAAMASDYAMGEFQFLRKMLLFHGRINYIRIAEMILYFFYKNFLFTIPQFFFAFNCGFSGQTLYDDWFVSLYNLIFTSLPLLFKAIIEQDVTVEDESGNDFIKQNVCKTYYLGRESEIFNLTNFFLEIFLSLCGAIVVFYFIYAILYNSPMIIEGQVADFWIISISQFTSIIFIVNFKILVTQRYHTYVNVLIIFFTSYMSYIAYFLISSLYSFSKSQATSFNLIKTPHFYLCIFLISGIFFIWELTTAYVKLCYFDNPINLIKKFTNVSFGSKQSETEGLISDYQKKIIEYDDNMRNKYKIKRIEF